MSAWPFCYRHQTVRGPGEQCAQCAAEQDAAHARDTLNTLESRIADLEARLLSTNRQLAELQHARIGDMTAHNALVPYLLAYAERVGLLP